MKENEIYTCSPAKSSYSLNHVSRGSRYRNAGGNGLVISSIACKYRHFIVRAHEMPRVRFAVAGEGGCDLEKK